MFLRRKEGGHAIRVSKEGLKRAQRQRRKRLEKPKGGRLREQSMARPVRSQKRLERAWAKRKEALREMGKRRAIKITPYGRR